MYHVHPFLSLMLCPSVSKCRFGVSVFHPAFRKYLGVGVDVSYRQNSFIAYRLSAFTQPFDTKIKLKGIQYKTEDSSHSIGLLLDIFPFENAFRVYRRSLLLQIGYNAFHFGKCNKSHLQGTHQSNERNGYMGKARNLTLALVGKVPNNQNPL